VASSIISKKQQDQQKTARSAKNSKISKKKQDQQKKTAHVDLDAGVLAARMYAGDAS
jgi:high-affinity Fe2+/Pb2+ permease